MRDASSEETYITHRKASPWGFRESTQKLQFASIASEPPCIEYGLYPGTTGGSSKWRLAMKYSVLKATVAGIFLLGLLGPGVRAQDSAGVSRQGNDGCSNSTLKGDYAFTVSGQVFLPGPNNTTLVVQREGIAMTHFDGVINLSQVDFVLSSPNAPPPPGVPPTDPLTGFHTEENGTYTVYPDCTGTFTIQDPDFVNTTIPGPIITVKFVLSDRGRSIHAIVTSLIPPGAKGPVPALIHSEGHKLGRIGEDRD